jgi:organic hydroperoxide reductase OsmC/OhrA
MSEHHATIEWRYAPSQIRSGTYSRNHVATLNGAQRINVSAAAEYSGDPSCTDPEQLLVNAVASCHMLVFLAIADAQGYRVDSYTDRAVGHLEAGEGGATFITRIELSPTVVFAGDKLPDAAAIEKIHERAHRKCFVANSIRSKVTIRPFGS